VNTWLADIFHPDNVDHTVAALLASQDGAERKTSEGDAAKKRLADAEARIRKFQAAIAADVDPSAVVEVINAAQAGRAAAQAEINNTPAPDLMDAADLRLFVVVVTEDAEKIELTVPAGGRITFVRQETLVEQVGEFLLLDNLRHGRSDRDARVLNDRPCSAAVDGAYAPQVV
jgi:hypothetical protein